MFPHAVVGGHTVYFLLGLSHAEKSSGLEFLYKPRETKQNKAPV